MFINCSFIAFLPSQPTLLFRLWQLVVIFEGSLCFGKVLFNRNMHSCSKPPPGKARRDCRRRTYFEEYFAKNERPPVDNDQRDLQVLVESSLVVIGEESLSFGKVLRKMRMCLCGNRLPGCRRSAREL